jgi:hypothetical protein
MLKEPDSDFNISIRSPINPDRTQPRSWAVLARIGAVQKRNDQLKGFETISGDLRNVPLHVTPTCDTFPPLAL